MDINTKNVLNNNYKMRQYGRTEIEKSNSHTGHTVVTTCHIHEDGSYDLEIKCQEDHETLKNETGIWEKTDSETVKLATSVTGEMTYSTYTLSTDGQGVYLTSTEDSGYVFIKQ